VSSSWASKSRLKTTRIRVRFIYRIIDRSAGVRCLIACKSILATNITARFCFPGLILNKDPSSKRKRGGGVTLAYGSGSDSRFGNHHMQRQQIRSWAARVGIFAITGILLAVPFLAGQQPVTPVAEQVNKKLVKLFGAGGFKGLPSYGTGI